MKRLPIFISFLIISFVTFSQEDTARIKLLNNLTFNKCISKYDSVIKKPIFTNVDIMPEFPGGQSHMVCFFDTTYKNQNEIDDCCAIQIEFLVNTNGKLSNFNIIKGLQKDLDDETIRVFQLMPKWKPGICNGKKVAVKMTYYIYVGLW
jgi:hypothetical protein